MDPYGETVPAMAAEVMPTFPDPQPTRPAVDMDEFLKSMGQFDQANLKGKKKAKKSKKDGGRSALSDLEQNWEDRYRDLTEYVKTNGNANVPVKYEADPKLAEWVAAQRGYQRKNLMTYVRFERLRLIGFDFTNGAAKQGKLAPWEQRFSELTQFVKTNGHANVPPVYVTFPKLGKWVIKQRKYHKNKMLLDVRFFRLRYLGFNFTLGASQIGKVKLWDKRFGELSKFVAENGHANVPRGHAKLGWWVDGQRKLFKKNKLSEVRTERLRHLSFTFDAREQAQKERAAKGVPEPVKRIRGKAKALVEDELGVEMDYRQHHPQTFLAPPHPPAVASFPPPQPIAVGTTFPPLQPPRGGHLTHPPTHPTYPHLQPPNPNLTFPPPQPVQIQWTDPRSYGAPAPFLGS